MPVGVVHSGCGVMAKAPNRVELAARDGRKQPDTSVLLLVMTTAYKLCTATDGIYIYYLIYGVLVHRDREVRSRYHFMAIKP